MKHFLLLFFLYVTFCSANATNHYSEMMSAFQANNVERANALARIDALNGNGKAMYNLALLYYKEGQVNDAFRWFQKASSSGVMQAYVAMAIIDFSKEDYSKAIKHLSHHNEGVLVTSLNAICYDMIHHTSKASAKSYYEVGELFYNDYLVHPNTEVAFKLVQQSAKKGYKPAFRLLGKIYLGERVGTTSLLLSSNYVHHVNLAIEAFSVGASLGDVASRYYLGEIYLKGPRGVRNFTKAINLLTIAANEGSDEAKFQLGVCLIEGNCGLPADAKRAYTYLLDARSVCDSFVVLSKIAPNRQSANAYQKQYAACSEVQLKQSFHLPFLPY